MSSSIQHTLGKKNRTLHTLALSATGLIEQEAPLIFNLSRVCEGLRGEGFEMRWEGDEERKREREREDAEERKEEEEEEERRRKREFERLEEKREEERKENERLEKIEEERNRVFEEEKKARREQEKKEDEEREKLFLELKQAEDDAALAAAEAKAALERAAAAAAPPPPPPPPPTDLIVEEAIPATTSIDPSLSAAAEPNDIPVNDANPLLPAAPATLLDESSTQPPPDVQHMDQDTSMASIDPPLPVASTSAAVIDESATPIVVVVANPDSALPIVEESSLPPLPSTSTDALVAVLNPADLPSAMEVDPEREPEVSANPTEDEAVGSPAVRRRSGRVAQRATDPNHHHRSTSESEESEDEERRLMMDTAADHLANGVGAEGAGVVPAGGMVDEHGMGVGAGLEGIDERPLRVVEEDLPEYARRMVDPEVYVRSLFVSPESVEMAGPPGSAPVTEMISPNEQEVMLHDCLT